MRPHRIERPATFASPQQVHQVAQGPAREPIREHTQLFPGICIVNSGLRRGGWSAPLSTNILPTRHRMSDIPSPQGGLCNWSTP